MRITIDTELQCIIVPNSYYAQIDKLNVIIDGAGGKRLDYTQYIRDCFETAIDTKILRHSDVIALKPRKNKRDSGENHLENEGERLKNEKIHR